MSEPKFTPIEIGSWPRYQAFYYFSTMAPTSYSMTVDVDITGLRPVLRNRGLKFYPTYLWLVTRCLNRQVEFKVAYKDDVLGYYETLTPFCAQFHEDDKTFSMMWTEYCDDLEEFHARYVANQQSFSSVHGFLSQPQTPPPANAYTVSSLPWIRFKHFAVHSHESKPYFFPSVEAGRIVCEGERETLPLSLTCHHATTDGYHLSKFLEDLDEEIKRLL